MVVHHTIAVRRRRQWERDEGRLAHEVQMTMIPLPPELEVAIRKAAAREGITEEAFVVGAIEQALESWKEDDSDEELHPDWGPELTRRCAEIEAGQVRMIPAEEALATIRADLAMRPRVAG